METIRHKGSFVEFIKKASVFDGGGLVWWLDGEGIALCPNAKDGEVSVNLTTREVLKKTT